MTDQDDMRQTRWLLAAQSLALLGGSMFAWSKLVPQFTAFYAQYGTFLHFSDCVVPNPFATACLYGSIAFLVALYWSLVVYQTPSYRSERNLRTFLLFCVLFAGSVLTLEALQFYKVVGSAVSVSCTPGASPVGTPCFYGALFFIAAWSLAVAATRRLRAA